MAKKKKRPAPTDREKAEALGKLLMRKELTELAELRKLAAAVLEYEAKYAGNGEGDMSVAEEEWATWVGDAKNALEIRERSK
jgi:hypothetical protein